MKYLLPFILMLLFIQCNQTASSKARVTETDSKEIKGDNFAGSVEDRLAQSLRRSAGVFVNKLGSSYTVKVSGLNNSFMTNTSPLFVIDGISMGHEFASAAGAIAGNGIKSVRVLKGQEASFYGTRGSAGVIVVKTDKPKLK